MRFVLRVTECRPKTRRGGQDCQAKGECRPEPVVDESDLSQLSRRDGSEELTYVHSAKFPKSALVVYLSPNFKSDTNVTCGSNSYKNEPSSSEEEFLEETWLVRDSL